VRARKKLQERIKEVWHRGIINHVAPEIICAQAQELLQPLGRASHCIGVSAVFRKKHRQIQPIIWLLESQRFLRHGAQPRARQRLVLPTTTITLTHISFHLISWATRRT
jgi:hypothetical protein